MSTTELNESGTIDIPTQQDDRAAPTKADLKRQQIYMDRMRRHMAKGMTPEAAHAAIMKEDYDRLPIAKKIERLEGLVNGAVAGLANDLRQLHHNQQVLSDVMDVNFAAYAKLLARAGVTDEEVKAAVKEAEDNLRAERAAQRAAAEAQQAVRQEEAEKKDVVEAAAQPGEPPPPPEEATSFGG